MLLNLSNHPLSKWEEKQRKVAEREFGTIADLPFPPVAPDASSESVRQLVDQYVEQCLRLFQEESVVKDRERLTSPQSEIANPQSAIQNAVHLMGEFTFTYQFVKEMEKRNVLCVASTTERIVTDNPDGSKTTVFQFVRFRPYFEMLH